MDSEILRNKKAYFNYEVLDTYDAGMVLHGYEVKAVRQKHINLGGSYVSIHNGEVWLENATIAPYQPKNQPPQTIENGSRKRKLLLNKREIIKLITQSEAPGTTVIPLKIFLQDQRIKLTIGVCRGKKQHDKRASIKKREEQRQMMQKFRNH